MGTVVRLTDRAGRFGDIERALTMLEHMLSDEECLVEFYPSWPSRMAVHHLGQELARLRVRMNTIREEPGYAGLCALEDDISSFGARLDNVIETNAFGRAKNLLAG